MYRTMKLRPYQKLALEAVAASWQRVDRALMQMATGAGKTVVFAELLRQQLCGTDKQGVVLVHRQELLEQAIAKIRQAWPRVEIGIVRRQQVEIDRQIVVASIPSLYRRLHLIDPAHIGLVVVDEAHHAPAKSWQATIDTLTSKGAKCLGVTATPERNHSVGLGEVFDELCFTRSLADLIPQYLCDLRVVRVETQLDLDDVRSRQGDFVVSDLDRAVNCSDRNQMVVESWMRFGENRPTVAYCVSVEHAIALAETFTSFQIPALPVHGRQTPQQRQTALEQFQSGQISILTNCQVLTEGWDCPQLQCLVMARPTQSSLLFSQIVGRGTRKARGKKDCLVLDIADNTKRHKLQNVHRLFGLAPTVDLSQLGAAKQAKAQKEAEICRLREETEKLQRMDRIIIDLLLDADTALPSRYGWTPLAGGCWFVKIPEQEPDYSGDLLQIRYTADTGATLLWISKTKMVELAAAPSLHHLVEIADEWIERHLRFTTILLDQTADWRQHPASESQKSYIRSLLRRLAYFDLELHERLSDRLRHVESAEALSDFYALQGTTVPEELERRRLTKGAASHLIAFLKERLTAY